MRVKKDDGCCRSCKGQLRITEVEDDLMHIECLACGDTYQVEVDAFNDGGVIYHFAMMMRRLEGQGGSD